MAGELIEKRETAPTSDRERQKECRRIGCRRKGYWISEEGICVPTRHDGEKHIVVVTFEEIDKAKTLASERAAHFSNE